MSYRQITLTWSAGARKGRLRRFGHPDGASTLAPNRYYAMSLLRRFFPTAQERRDVEQARQIIEHALRESRKPKGCAKSAESGADIRDRLLTLVEEIEKETGEPAVVFAADGTLTDPRLVEALHKRGDDGGLLELSIGSCFVNPHATQYVNESWPAAVKRYQSRPNSDELIHEKATLLAAFVVHNLSAAVESREQLKAAGFEGVEQSLIEEQEVLVKCEEAALWYRVIDELAYRFISGHSPLFVDYFLDKVAHLLALQGVPPDRICRTMAERSQEYGQYREWCSSDDSRMAGTLLWHAGKHVGMPFGLERHFMFTTIFGTLFLMRVERALVYELLTGQQKKE